MVNKAITVHSVRRGVPVSKYRRFGMASADRRLALVYLTLLSRLAVMLSVAVLHVAYAQNGREPGIQPLGTIVTAARDYLLQQNSTSGPFKPQVTVGAPDPRLRLAVCGDKLEAFTPPGQKTLGNTTVGVRCSGANPWTIYVQASVALIEPVLVAQRPLSRGTVLSGDDVTLAEKDVARMTQGYLTDIKDINGMVLKYSVTAGAVLRPSLLQPPIVIKRGERVILLAEGGGIQVKMEGQSLMDGAVGDIIRVRNLSSHRVVEGTVVSPGVVQVRF